MQESLAKAGSVDTLSVSCARSALDLELTLFNGRAMRV